MDSRASSIKLSGGAGAEKYQDFGFVGNWSLDTKPKAKSKMKNKEQDTDENDEGSKILTSVQSTKSSGSTTNEYKLGYDPKISEITSAAFDGYYRTEPSSVHVIGIEPEFSFDYDDLILSELSTGFTLGFDFSRSTTKAQPAQANLPPAQKKVNESFTAAGITLGISQEIFDGFKASLSGAFYHYTIAQTKIPGIPKRLVNLKPLDNTLSSLGDPEKSITFGLSWDWAEKWSSSYSLAKTKTYFDGLTTINSSLELDHTFSDRWEVGLGYSWSSAAAYAGSLDATYSW